MRFEKLGPRHAPVVVVAGTIARRGHGRTGRTRTGRAPRHLVERARDVQEGAAPSSVRGTSKAPETRTYGRPVGCVLPLLGARIEKVGNSIRV